MTQESRIVKTTSKCNVCGGTADFVIQLEINKRIDKYKHPKQMPFYVCKFHKHFYHTMQKGIDLKHLFDNTIDEIIWIRTYILIHALDSGY